MPVLTLKLPPETAARIARIAARRRVSKSTVVREALDEKLRDTPDELSVHDLMKGVAGAVDSGVRDRGHNPKHLARFGR